MVEIKDEQLRELTSIKKLLVLGLLRSGLTQKQIAAALGIDRSQVSRMFPSGTLTELSKKMSTD
jgi:DNA-directed RNA polymerase specialized sigma subunit